MIKAYLIGGSQHRKRKVLEELSNILQFPGYRKYSMKNNMSVPLNWMDDDADVDYMNISVRTIPNETYNIVKYRRGYLTHQNCYVYIKSNIDINTNKTLRKIINEQRRF